MILFKKAVGLRQWLDIQRQKGKIIGFVPTMGALHAGHISLVHQSLEQADLTVSSIFVNPTQFNDRADFEKYPHSPEADIRLLAEAGCQALYFPDRQEIYPEGSPAEEHYDLGYLETVFEGLHRPGHFQGVCMVVRRLLETVRPDLLFLGQKDYQQCLVIARLLELTHKTEGIRLVIGKTVRESDGLAMSSRNRRLSPEAREIAPALYKSLQYIKEHLRPGAAAALLGNASAQLADAGLQPEYLSLADGGTLEPVDHWDGQTPLVVLAAAYLEGVRLIDNIFIQEEVAV